MSHQFLRAVARPYPDTLFALSLDLVTKSLRQNGSELVKRALAASSAVKIAGVWSGGAIKREIWRSPY